MNRWMSSRARCAVRIVATAARSSRQPATSEEQLNRAISSRRANGASRHPAVGKFDWMNNLMGDARAVASTTSSRSA